MRLRIESAGAGPDVVLIHGWGMNAGVWAPLAKNLARDRRVHVVDLPGHGASDYDPGQRGLADWARALRLAVPSGATWVGWSLGAQIAIRAAIDAPEQVGRLVLVAGTPRFVQGDDWPHAMARATFEQFAASLAADHAGALERFLALQVRGADHARETLRSLRQEVHQRPRPRDSALDDGLQLLLETDLRLELRRLPQPTLWLLGERDTLVPAAMGDELAVLQPDADVLVIGGAAHAPFLSHPARSRALLARFLEESSTNG
jgi:pimeloyl-[acyl-carrier protein] methyl ester esterase